jgi:hypothetical protein
MSAMTTIPRILPRGTMWEVLEGKNFVRLLRFGRRTSLCLSLFFKILRIVWSGTALVVALVSEISHGGEDERRP